MGKFPTIVSVVLVIAVGTVVGIGRAPKAKEPVCVRHDLVKVFNSPCATAIKDELLEVGACYKAYGGWHRQSCNGAMQTFANINCNGDCSADRSEGTDEMVWVRARDLSFDYNATPMSCESCEDDDEDGDNFDLFLATGEYLDHGSKYKADPHEKDLQNDVEIKIEPNPELLKAIGVETRH